MRCHPLRRNRRMSLASACGGYVERLFTAHCFARLIPRQRLRARPVPGGFKVVDSTGQSFAYVYGPRSGFAMMKGRTRTEAMRRRLLLAAVAISSLSVAALANEWADQQAGDWGIRSQRSHNTAFAYNPSRNGLYLVFGCQKGQMTRLVLDLENGRFEIFVRHLFCRWWPGDNQRLGNRSIRHVGRPCFPRRRIGLRWQFAKLGKNFDARRVARWPQQVRVRPKWDRRSASNAR